MHIIVSDSSCLIDLKKGGLLKAIFDLPYSFAIPQPLFADELISLSDTDKTELLEMGMEVITLSGPQVLVAQAYYNRERRLKLNDCFALVLSEELEDSILLTGDSPLRALAEEKGIEVHGVIWVVDQLAENSIAPLGLLHDALVSFMNDPFVFLPDRELRRRIRKFRKIL